MDTSLIALTGNGTQISNDVYTTAVRNRDNLRNAQAAADGASRTVETLQSQIDSAAFAVWDSDAPAKTGTSSTPSAATTTAAASTTATTAASSTSSTSSTSTTGATATAATANASNATNATASPATAAGLLASNSEVHGCNAGIAPPTEVDLSKAQHIDAGHGNEASQALLFWRLGRTPGLPAEAAAAESAAIVPRLRIENLGDRLRIRSEKPLMVFFTNGVELPISFADVSVPGEHTLSGTRAAAEIQLIHMPDDPAKAAALSLQMDVGAENPWFEHSLGEALPKAGDATEVQGADPMAMHPAFVRGVAGHFYQYNGRLLKDSRCASIRPFTGFKFFFRSLYHP
eukprot:Skav236084  [mRNA]  locus=scaffold2910:3075:4109:- [translate_table: standard]